MSLRVLWLLNHSSARKFEIAMLKKIGVKQIFTPKSFPADPSFRSASVDYSEDQYLEIPAAELAVLNNADWYQGATPDAWKIANEYFDIVFFIVSQPEVLINISKYFHGLVLWRTYGLEKTMSYGRVAEHFNQFKNLQKIGSRLYFGEAYPHLADIEPEILKSRRIYLPLGMANPTLLNNWEGREKHIYFVCPDIGFNPYYKKIYNAFCSSFQGINYVIAGAQPIRVDDPNVLGYVTNEQHAHNMAQSRVMFYHSQEPNHVHYHPFEAIRAGMPLVFMAGGMLDTMGGVGLPGRCKTIEEARQKIERIIGDDWALIDRIRTSQHILLEGMKPENCEPAWREGFARLERDLDEWRKQQAERPIQIQRKKIAVVLPVNYRGGSLRGALALAKALYLGSRQWAEDAEITFVHPDDPATYSDDVFCDLPEDIKRRTFQWKILSMPESRRAMRYAGFQGWEPDQSNYLVPDDGMQQLLDCDLWVIVSDRLMHPVLPIKPVVLMVFDYLQRYVDLLSHGADMPFLNAARHATRVLVTTQFTEQDAIQYAGVNPQKVRKVPMLPPEFPFEHTVTTADAQWKPFFLWATNAAPHKNQGQAAEALQIYYEELDGSLDCRVTGVNSKGMLISELPHLRAMADIFSMSKLMRKRIKWMGELPEGQYWRLLSKASFIWHPGRVDNGTFTVIEAASVGVPALSSDYPAMREIDQQFSLNLCWMKSDSPRQMAERLKRMESELPELKKCLPSLNELALQRIEHHAKAYWQEVRTCL